MTEKFLEMMSLRALEKSGKTMFPVDYTETNQY
jgi:hypothetical protein